MRAVAFKYFPLALNTELHIFLTASVTWSNLVLHPSLFPSHDQCAQTKMTLCISVCQLYCCCAARLCCWRNITAHGASKDEFASESRSQETLFPLQGRETCLQKDSVHSLCLLLLIGQICWVTEKVPMKTLLGQRGQGYTVGRYTSSFTTEPLTSTT